MIDILFNRSTIITLAVIGGLISLFVSWNKSRNVISPENLKFINTAAYFFTGVSIILFIGAGLFGIGGQDK